MRMLVDSGAAISVVRNDVLSDSCRKKNDYDTKLLWVPMVCL